MTRDNMSTDAGDAVRAVAARISAAWQERRYDDLGDLFAEDMAFTFPGMAGRVEGRDAIVASYREFMDRITLTSYVEDPLVVQVWGDTAVAGFRWEMAWLAGGVPNQATGHDVFAFRLTERGWRAIWRTMSFD
jgi:uncharacterized protein (TIGR02246 family)